MAVPKKKTSKSRRDMRRAHLRLEPILGGECQTCGEKKLPHHVCAVCGHYNRRPILKDSRIFD
ncbi:MAG: 50S ribosomal protein L32 [Holosporales bacterium]|jgi:large subunit ribosomal protein L32|nr:50S ribosomal protein L32 [Holosporales bacterium]